MSLEIFRDKEKAYLIINKQNETKLTRISSRIFDILQQNLNKPVKLVDLVNYVYDLNLKESDWFKVRSIDVHIHTKLKPFVNALNMYIHRDKGNSITLIKRND